MPGGSGLGPCKLAQLIHHASMSQCSPVQAPGALAVPEEAAADVYERGRAFHARPSGLDAVEFLLAAGPAEPLRPLVRCTRVFRGFFCWPGGPLSLRPLVRCTRALRVFRGFISCSRC